MEEIDSNNFFSTEIESELLRDHAISAMKEITNTFKTDSNRINWWELRRYIY
ncbi:hypothetical protein EZS27_037791 [termite gut metagenome]|uniref:Uncharacterized protein n=1 Tax=termite gut metagenome TaxID=433724 RepID=A0A5J4PRX9_9ZZZZ